MNDEQDNEHGGILGWVLGLAVFIAIAVSLLTALVGVFSGNEVKPANPVTAAAPIVAAAAPVMADAGKPQAVKVYFESGKFALPVGTNESLKALVAYANASPNAKLGISGFHDKTGDPAANAELAKNRAKAVVEELKAAGIAPDRVMLQKPQEVLGGADDKEARRVEVYIAQ